MNTIVKEGYRAWELGDAKTPARKVQVELAFEAEKETVTLGQSNGSPFDCEINGKTLVSIGGRCAGLHTLWVKGDEKLLEGIEKTAVVTEE